MKAETPESPLNSQVLELKKLLQSHGIPLEQWGVGKAKTLEHLATEVLEGETELIQKDGEIVRRVVAARVEVRCMVGDTEFRLLEDRQEFKDGRVRRRGLTGLSEKMKPGEDPIASAKRALSEELGLQADTEIEMLGTREESNASQSYPGLTTEYLFYEMSTTLPAADFNPNGYVEHQADKSTYFIWQAVPQQTE